MQSLHGTSREHYFDGVLESEERYISHQCLASANFSEGVFFNKIENSSGVYPENNDVVLRLAPGSVVFMSSYLYHKSESNKTNRFRTAYMPQYSLRPITNSPINRNDSQDDGKIVAFAIGI
ncbi:hypothetical protein AX774_g1810 [Zancudomyces culisetae]|uniref:Uncharacterized protein n=1 Tax=Zancudomyces culisetae TaxID=1213189 RepID=A0A1R1PUJ6_ZANCU|nr:hypothetical protein AX774_g1810 [Zancudomyces culisetae]|eukprot:OMH84650.1 hypothetical protein AX774_g1810 [Zancudomyces culisetae]